MNIKITNVYLRNFQAYLNKFKKIAINQGGTACFSGCQKVVTDKGNIPISEIKTGDTVKSFNEITGEAEWKSVKNVFKYSNIKPTVIVRLKNGKTITVTEDHKFYFEGSWHTIKDILAMRGDNGRNLEADIKI